ncbi:serine/threonine-protein kinase/endoribonuclease IRE1b-like protein [Tanacetum coccineum]
MNNLQRLDYIEVYIHPFFWTWDQRLDFIHDMSDYLLWLLKKYPDCSFLDRIKRLTFASGWKSKIDSGWKKDMIQDPKSPIYWEDTLGLLQLIRNTSQHIREKEHCNGRDRRWLEKQVRRTFPSLFMNIYHEGKYYTGCEDDPILGRYYRSEFFM